MAAAPAKPLEEVPAEFKEDVAKLQKPLAAILVGKGIFWATQAALTASGYVTVEADRWNTPAAARENGPRDLGFQDGENGFNAQTSASRRCASFRQFGWQPTWSGGATNVTTRRALGHPEEDTFGGGQHVAGLRGPPEHPAGSHGRQSW